MQARVNTAGLDEQRQSMVLELYYRTAEGKRKGKRERERERGRGREREGGRTRWEMGGGGKKCTHSGMGRQERGREG